MEMGMPKHDIIVVGASAGGVEALMSLVSTLPADLPAAVFVTLHLPPNSTSVLPRLLDRAGPLAATHAEDGEVIKPGRIYVAPPDRHLLIEDGRVQLAHGPRENRWRPAIDPMFRTAARAYGARVVGVVLTGTMDDGTAGLVAIKRCGGVAVVQEPSDALFPGMPTNALLYVDVDHTLPLARMSELLARLAHEPVAQEGELGVSDDLEHEVELAAMHPDTLVDEQRAGTPSQFGCPECGGVLWEIKDGALTRYRCRVGHAYSAETLLLSMNETFEDALWVALRALEERASLVRRLAERASTLGHPEVAARFQAQNADTQRHLEVIRQVLVNGGRTQPANERSQVTSAEADPYAPAEAAS